MTYGCAIHIVIMIAYASLRPSPLSVFPKTRALEVARPKPRPLIRGTRCLSTHTLEFRVSRRTATGWTQRTRVWQALAGGARTRARGTNWRLTGKFHDQRSSAMCIARSNLLRRASAKAQSDATMRTLADLWLRCHRSREQPSKRCAKDFLPVVLCWFSLKWKEGPLR